MKRAHTPGPWFAVGSWVETADDKADICTCSAEGMDQQHVARPPEEEEANARLIAAAPDMLRLLRLMARGHKVYEGEARDIVALATGEKA
jgi:hypothetical protein